MLKVEIRLKGHIKDQRSGWFDGLMINYTDPDETILTGIVSDQPALYTVISHLRDLGIQLTSLSCEDLMDQNPP